MGADFRSQSGAHLLDPLIKFNRTCSYPFSETKVIKVSPRATKKSYGGEGELEMGCSG